jgi:uncharacterized protein
MLQRVLQTARSGLKLAPRHILMTLVNIYRLFFKAWLGNTCRFEPSCSTYALQALDQHGAAKGVWLTGGRLLRCHPYCAGGCDPVPHEVKNPVAGLFSRLGLYQVDNPADRSVIRK